MISIINFLNKLEKAHIFYSLSKSREDAVMVEITVPGEKWEVEYFDNGNIEIEVYKSDGEIHNEDKLDDLFKKFSD
jgi:hypothetical protein